MSQLKEGKFKTFDDVQLYYRAWLPETPSAESVIILHRGHEHSGRVGHLVKELGLENKNCFAFDLRGHGLSDGSRGWAPSFDTWVKDLNAFSIFIRTNYNIQMQETVVVANSVGSVMAVQWVHDYSPGVRGLVLAAPAFAIKLYVPFALTFLRIASWFTDKLFVNSYVKSSMLTRDEQQAQSYDNDKLITKRIAVSILVSLFDSVKRLMNDAASIEIPIMVLSAGSDFVVNNKVQKEFVDKISSTKKEFIQFPKFRHAIFHEKDRETVLAPAKKFIQDCFDSKKKNLPMIIPQAREFSIRQYVSLKKQPSRPKQVYYYILRKGLEKLGPLSEGMNVGLTYGFDSGISLDYVYRNKPQGRFGIGKVIDYFYLNAVGWKGIRHRKKHLKNVLKKTIQTLNAKGQKPVILDCAAGCGRYLFETINELNQPIEVHLRDINQLNLEVAKKTSQQLQVNLANFECVDAFNEQSYQNSKIKPNIVIVSGLFELFSDNQLLHTTLSGIKNIMQNGGYILYTGQPWHPQLEVIARVLNNHQGRRWVMRTRVQAELDELVNYAGFKKLDTEIDDLGIFTVSVAQNA